ncbi:ComEA family DNA-binding protein [Myceligenerans indicum]|uniref:ComEA family DNA-binding protein n=1 Tax=Myceligenerans indicum TaxID=2593663 RepID=A0ABS1LNV8_9MICO|nr:ComEA family DNA-binding protein [Myceligenerans indicum]MBL0887873.1 ComEA family DNA-binding protein [Myceligenerans indicum]
MRADTDVVPEVPEPADDLVTRLRQHRSADRVAAAYAAAHGHPVGHEGGTERRWALGRRPGTVAVVAVLLLACVAGAVVLGRDAVGAGAVRPIASADNIPAGPVASDAAGEGREPVATTSDGDAPQAADADAGIGGAGPQNVARTGLVAHVVGAVRRPGLVELPAGARIADAVEAAGGPTGEADLSGVNLARPVTDGEQVHVPTPGEEARSLGGAGEQPPGYAEAIEAVDLNTADTAALDTLPGIGPALARRIIDWRTVNGPFASVDELDGVSGIGPSVLEQIRPLARV